MHLQAAFQHATQQKQALARSSVIGAEKFAGDAWHFVQRCPSCAVGWTETATRKSCAKGSRKGMTKGG
jgi:hypothetical protein